MLKEMDLPFLSVPDKSRHSARALSESEFIEFLKGFSEFGTETRQGTICYQTIDGVNRTIPAFINEFWTSGQRAANNLQEISYRACFKPQLPRFFIERLTVPGDRVYDPFMGRGTTLVEAALLHRLPAGNDINPLSAALARPRLSPPSLDEIEERLGSIPFNAKVDQWDDLLVFYHPETLRELTALKQYLLDREQTGEFDRVDDWIRMVALNRLTGHSPGFFSVYTLPPNQAVSIRSQVKINQRRGQVPPRRNVSEIILKKSRSLLQDLASAQQLQALRKAGNEALLVNSPAAEASAIPSESVALVVTSPPFLDVVQYAVDNWLRCWFIGIEAEDVKLTVPAKLSEWQAEMTRVLRELKRVMKQGGYVAFEVGEVRGGKVKLDETVLTCGCEAGLEPVLVLIQEQEFTKTANCWGVNNNSKGTNTNRIVLFRKS
jgi:hypothetical protein